MHIVKTSQISQKGRDRLFMSASLGTINWCSSHVVKDQDVLNSKSINALEACPLQLFRANCTLVISVLKGGAHEYIKLAVFCTYLQMSDLFNPLFFVSFR